MICSSVSEVFVSMCFFSVMVWLIVGVGVVFASGSL